MNQTVNTSLRVQCPKILMRINALRIIGDITAPQAENIATLIKESLKSQCTSKLISSLESIRWQVSEKQIIDEAIRLVKGENV